MSTSLYQCIQNNEKMIAAIDQLLETGNWDDSLFLRANKKRFLALREKIESLNAQAHASLSQAETSKKITCGENQRLIYILLHQAQGHQLSHWEQSIKGLVEHSAGRPIYNCEEHVKAAIRSKPYPSREGYVVLVADQDDILQSCSGRQITDRLGHPLLTLKEKAVRFDRMVEFFNDGHRYRFHNGHLQLINHSEATQFFEGKM